MLFLSILHHYLLWHYTRAFLEIFHVWTNFIWYIINLFSIPQLLRSWFAPWKRIVETRGDKWNLEDLAAFIIIGIISRILGFLVRSIIIILGTICLLITIVFGVLVYAFWLLAPALIIALLGLSVGLFFA